jgi:hypothetical protein
MSRGIRTFTRERVLLQNEQNPWAIGPLLGALIMHFNIPVSMISELLGMHDQTVFRWCVNQAQPSAAACSKIKDILMILLWMYQEQVPPFTGTLKRKKVNFARCAKDFLTEAESVA